MTTSDQTDPGVRVPRGRRTIRIVVLCVAMAAILFLAVTPWIRSR